MEHKSNLCAGQRFWWPSDPLLHESAPCYVVGKLISLKGNWGCNWCCRCCYYYYYLYDICIDGYLAKKNDTKTYWFIYIWPLWCFLFPFPMAGFRMHTHSHMQTSCCFGKIEIELRTLKKFMAKTSVAHTALSRVEWRGKRVAFRDFSTVASLSASLHVFASGLPTRRTLCGIGQGCYHPYIPIYKCIPSRFVGVSSVIRHTTQLSKQINKHTKIHFYCSLHSITYLFIFLSNSVSLPLDWTGQMFGLWFWFDLFPNSFSSKKNGRWVKGYPAVQSFPSSWAP